MELDPQTTQSTQIKTNAFIDEGGLKFLSLNRGATGAGLTALSSLPFCVFRVFCRLLHFCCTEMGFNLPAAS
jgi:hypothetical protein